MLTRLGDLDQSFALMDELRRRMDHVWDDFDRGSVRRVERAGAEAGTGPRISLHDAGQALLVTVDVPGMTEKDVQASINDGTLTISGAREAEAPGGYSVHRRERSGYRFARSVALPARVDAEKTTATVNDGVLTVTLAKIPEAQPRRIAVHSQS
jgi:HSP20 family protein